MFLFKPVLSLCLSLSRPGSSCRSTFSSSLRTFPEIINAQVNFSPFPSISLFIVRVIELHVLPSFGFPFTFHLQLSQGFNVHFARLAFGAVCRLITELDCLHFFFLAVTVLGAHFADAVQETLTFSFNDNAEIRIAVNFFVTGGWNCCHRDGHGGDGASASQCLHCVMSGGA